MTKEHKLYELSKELVYQMTGKYTEDVQDSDFQIAWTYLNKAMDFIHCCESDSEQLKGKHPMNFAKWRESEGYTPYDNTSYQKDNKIFNVDKLEIKYRAYYKTF